MNTEESEVNNDSAGPEPEKKKKEKRKEKKHKQKKRKHKASDSELENRSRKSKSKSKKRKRSKERKSAKKPKVDDIDVPGPSVPVELLVEQSKSRAPMTKEEWEKSQSVIRRVYDETGRSRLVKGDGEILEEIVSKDRHREINRQANIGDGLYFQSKLHTDKK